MRTIRRKKHSFVPLIAFAALVGAWLFVRKGGGCESWMLTLQAGLLLSGAALAALLLRGRRERNVARLITENPILHIRTAVISELSGERARDRESEHAEVIVSYFGILLGERIIKFNQKGIWIRAVEIGGDFISFTYGTERRTQNIHLLRPAIDPAELDRFAEKIRYETGVTAVFIPEEGQKPPCP